MQKYGFSEGDIVYLNYPTARKETIAVILVGEYIQSSSEIRMNHICRKNLAAFVGDLVTVKIFT